MAGSVQIFQMQAQPSPTLTMLLMIEEADGSATYKGTLEDVLALVAVSTADVQAAAQPLFNNMIINGDGVVVTQGTSFTSSSAIKNDDATYTLDQWLLISNGNNTANVTQDMTDYPIDQRAAIKGAAVTTNKQWGFVQIIENERCAPCLGGVASFGLRVKGTGIAKVRAAILSWTGTKDSITRDVVGAWNGSGTEPGWASGWTREGTVMDITTMVDWTTDNVHENIAIDTVGAKNIALVVWVDDTNAAIGEAISISAVRMNAGANTAAYVNREIATEEELCRRYLQEVALDAGISLGGTTFYTVQHKGLRGPASQFYAIGLPIIIDQYAGTEHTCTNQATAVTSLEESTKNRSRISIGNYSPNPNIQRQMIQKGTGGSVYADARL